MNNCLRAMRAGCELIIPRFFWWWFGLRFFWGFFGFGLVWFGFWFWFFVSLVFLGIRGRKYFLFALGYRHSYIDTMETHHSSEQIQHSLARDIREKSRGGKGIV